MADMIVRAGAVFAAPGWRAPAAAQDIVVRAGHIAAIRPAGRDAPDLGGPWAIALPALVNAHDHGRGLRPLAFGAADAALEMWLPALWSEPPVEPYVTAALAFGRMARSVGAVIHNHVLRRPEHLAAEARAVARAAKDVGVVCGFAIPIRDRNPLVYGAAEPLMRQNSAADQEAIRSSAPPIRPILEQLAAIDAIADELDGPDFRVMYAPVGPQWVQDSSLARVAEASPATGRGVQMHLFETRRQREWADAAYPGGLIAHLDQLGLLTPRLSVAHGVWLRDDECARLAERGVTVAVNTSSNLRLRSGIAPVARFRTAGLRFAIGLDGMAFDDDEDMLRELRLLYHLALGIGMTDALTPAELFAAAVDNGRALLGLGSGAITVGNRADILLLDRRKLAPDALDDAADPLGLILARARAEHVAAVMVAGRIIVQDARPTGVDLDALGARASDQARNRTLSLRSEQARIRRYQGALQRYYAAGEHRNPG